MKMQMSKTLIMTDFRIHRETYPSNTDHPEQTSKRLTLSDDSFSFKQINNSTNRPLKTHSDEYGVHL